MPREKSTSPPPTKNRGQKRTAHHDHRHDAIVPTPIPLLTFTLAKVLTLSILLSYLALHVYNEQLLYLDHTLALRFADHNGDGILDSNIHTLDMDASIDDIGQPVSMQWVDLKVERTIHAGTPAEKNITTVKKNSGSMKPGEITAVMGGSGSGKSTLLRALMGRQDQVEHVSGHIYINGHLVTKSDSALFSTLVGFVPQQDVMHDDFSVEENLQFSADWRLANEDFPLNKRRGIVDDVLSRLGISKWRHDRVGAGSDKIKSHISGGQKKRVNIGMELVSDPGILFLDEPTSGLDSATTLKIISVLKATSKNASLPIAAVVHQPSDRVFSMFDELLLMAKGGNVIYRGKTSNAVSYFSEKGFAAYVKDYTNPADFLMDIVEGIIVPDNIPADDYNYLSHPYIWWREHERMQRLREEQWETLPSSSSSSSSSLMDSDSNSNVMMMVKKCTGFEQQYRLFFYRSMYLLQKNSGMADILLVSFVAAMCAASAAKLMEKFGVNLVASSLANQAVVLGASMIAVVQAVPEFEMERLTYERERDVGLNVYAFVVAKFLSSMFAISIMMFIFVIVYTLVLHVSVLCLMTSGPPRSASTVPRSVASLGGVLQLYWMLVVNAFAASSHAQVISLLLPPDKAMLAGVLMLMVMNLASNISEKLGEISFMSIFNLWCLTLDALPSACVVQMTKKRAIDVALSEVRAAQRQGNVGWAACAEKMIPKLKNDEDVLRSYHITRDIGLHAELVLVISGVVMRLIAICLLSHRTTEVNSLFVVYLVLWGSGCFRVARHSGVGVSKKEAQELNEAKKVLEMLASKSEAELEALVVYGKQLVSAPVLSTAELQEKNKIGERLYPLIQAHQPETERCGKITGMLLEGLENDELYLLLESPVDLKAEVDDAVRVLDEHNK